MFFLASITVSGAYLIKLWKVSDLLAAQLVLTDMKVATHPQPPQSISTTKGLVSRDGE
jgi:hypothetical protein